MKKAIKLLSLCLAIFMMVISFTACESSDIKSIEKNGKIIVGITDFAPMDYQDADGEWIGFDAELAKAFADYLEVDVEFVEITWSQKANELKNKNIDLVWNGMTITEDVKELMDVSVPYCKNAQVVVMKKDVIANYADVASMKELSFAVEKGSAGEEMATENGFKTVEVDKQSKALMEVASGTADAAIVDLLMAGAMIGEGTDYENLAFGLKLNGEEYGIGMRKGSDIADKLNEFLKKAYEDGTIAELAEEYKISENIIEIK